MKIIIVLLLLFLATKVSAQQFSIGDRLTPTSANFQLLGISSKTGVSTYKYIGEITDKYFYNRQVGDITVGFKNGMVVTTVYNLIPAKGDIGVPKSLIRLVQKASPFPFAFRNGVWGVNIDNETIGITRATNSMTFNKDRIMFFSSVKSSILSR